MPTYEYVCEKCSHQFEKSQPIVDKPLAVCPKELCPEKKWGKGKVKRRISTGGGLIFKGSGFYTTDYRSDKYKEAAKKDVAPAASTGSESKSGSASSGEGKTAKSEAKPAPKQPKPSSS
jgi:putative FmdB family regulatory protein